MYLNKVVIDMNIPAVYLVEDHPAINTSINS